MGKSKTLTAEQINTIMTMAKAGSKNREIAEAVGCTESTVSRRISTALGIYPKSPNLLGCSKCIEDCLNCPKPDCNCNQAPRPHEQMHPVNAHTIDMRLDMLRGR